MISPTSFRMGPETVMQRAPVILDVLRREGWTLREILATHTHFDHVLAARELKAASGALFRIHQNDLEQLKHAPVIAERMTGMVIEPAPHPDAFVADGDTIAVGAIQLHVLFTPGHSPGHVSYVCPGAAAVFCGDTLFKGTIGRTDIPGANPEILRESILCKLMPLNDEYLVACGHGHRSTIGEERATNPFVLEWTT